MAQENDKPSRWKWFHVTFSTYGAWLPGDPRGFRTWKHRKHVEGDYKSPPPPGAFEHQMRRSRRLMKRDMVRLRPVQRRVAGQAMFDMLRAQGAMIVSIAVSAVHVHVVARLPDCETREYIGRAKKHAAHCLRAAGLQGGAWAKRCRTLPIKDRAHQINAVNYVMDHRAEGAWAWKWGEPLPKGNTIQLKQLEERRMKKQRSKPTNCNPSTSTTTARPDLPRSNKP